MRKIWLFVSDAGGWGVASNTASLVLYVVGLISASKHGASVTTFVLVALSVPLFWIGAFIAWKKQHDARLGAEQRVQSEPCISPKRYGQFGALRECGVVIVNPGYAARNVHILPVPIGASGYDLTFSKRSLLDERDHDQLLTAWLQHPTLPRIDGKELFSEMGKANMNSLKLVIKCQDNKFHPHESYCLLERDRSSGQIEVISLEHDC